MKKYKDSKGNIILHKDLKYCSSPHLLVEVLDVVEKKKTKVKKHGRRSSIRTKINNN